MKHDMAQLKACADVMDAYVADFLAAGPDVETMPMERMPFTPQQRILVGMLLGSDLVRRLTATTGAEIEVYQGKLDLKNRKGWSK